MFSWGISFQTSFWGVNGTAVAREGQGTPSRGPLLEHSHRVDHAVSSEDFGMEEAGASLLAGVGAANVGPPLDSLPSWRHVISRSVGCRPP